MSTKNNLPQNNRNRNGQELAPLKAKLQSFGAPSQPETYQSLLIDKVFMTADEITPEVVKEILEARRAWLQSLGNGLIAEFEEILLTVANCGTGVQFAKRLDREVYQACAVDMERAEKIQGHIDEIEAEDADEQPWNQPRRKLPKVFLQFKKELAKLSALGNAIEDAEIYNNSKLLFLLFYAALEAPEKLSKIMNVDFEDALENLNDQYEAALTDYFRGNR